MALVTTQMLQRQDSSCFIDVGCAVDLDVDRTTRTTFCAASTNFRPTRPRSEDVYVTSTTEARFLSEKLHPSSAC